MDFQASDYLIWLLFTFLEILAIRFIRRSDLKPLRRFMAFCLTRDLILMAGSCCPKYFWDTFWITQMLELVFLALLAGWLISPLKEWRFPAFAIAGMCVHYAFSGWPIFARPEQVFKLELTCCAIVFVSLLIGSRIIYQRQLFPFAVVLGVFVLADTVAAASYLTGNYSPRSASGLWVVGLSILAVVARERLALPQQQKCVAQACAQSQNDTSQEQRSKQQLKARLQGEILRIRESLM